MDLSLLIEDVDHGLNELTINLISDGTNGSFDVSQSTYTPAQDYVGNDSFALSVTDGVSSPIILTVNVNVTPVNDLPVAQSPSVTTNEDTALSIAISAYGSDVESSDLSYQVDTSPANGQLDTTTQPWVYTPDQDFAGTDTIEYSVSVTGTSEASDVATITINVVPVNDALCSITHQAPHLRQ